MIKENGFLKEEAKGKKKKCEKEGRLEIVKNPHLFVKVSQKDLLLLHN